MKRTWQLLALIILVSCISPYDPKITQDNPKLVVDGLITNQNGPHQVRLSYSAAYNNDESIFDRYIENATVAIQDDKGIQIQLRHIRSGIYETAADVKGEIGRSYSVQIVLQNGFEYHSIPELLKPVPEIDTVISEYNEFSEGFLRGQFTLFAELIDSPTTDEYYRWNWTHYRFIEYCRLIPDSRTGITYTVNCCENCWEIQRCTGCINVQSDKYVNSKRIRREIIRIPYDSKDPYFLLVEQYSLTKNAFQFWKTVSEQVNNSGGIFDKPPVTIQGNVFNTADSTEQVLGFFGASAVATKSIHFARNTIPKIPFGTPIIYQQLNVKCVSCPDSPFRTTKEPMGW